MRAINQSLVCAAATELLAIYNTWLPFLESRYLAASMVREYIHETHTLNDSAVSYPNKS